jgi:hypothetical protein
MSLADAEIPDPGEGGNEVLPKVTKENRGLYQSVLVILGIALVLLIIGWVVITAVGKSVPDGIPVVIATIVGALVAAISTGKAEQ